jgi:hypothetical protein
MSFAPGAFYVIAERLFVGMPIDKTDAHCNRTVAGRLYYAAYLATRDTLRTLKGNPDYNLDHEPLTQFLRFVVKDTWVQHYGELLEELRQIRVQSDYRLSLTVDRGDVGLRLRDAKYVLDNQAELGMRLKGVTLPASGK